MGETISLFWTEVYKREQSEKLSVLGMLPDIIYAMSGAPEEAPMDKRFDYMKPSMERAESAINRSRYTIKHKKSKIKNKIKKLEKQRDEFERLEAMKDDNFLFKWLDGEV